MNNCSYSNLLDIRPDNILSVSNCSYTYNNGVYHIVKADDSLNVSINFNLVLDSNDPIKLLFNNSNVVSSNSNISFSLRYYSNSWWGTVSNSYINGTNLGSSAVSGVTYHNSYVMLFISNAPHEFDIDLSKFFIQEGEEFSGFETYHCESLIPVVPEPPAPVINGIHLYSMIEDNFITDNYFINCGILGLFFTMIILLFCIPFIIIRKVKG